MDVAREKENMIVMYPEFGYKLDGEKKQIEQHHGMSGRWRQNKQPWQNHRRVTWQGTLRILNGQIQTWCTNPDIERDLRAYLEELETYGFAKTTRHLSYNALNR
jgi:hypothetical protein